MSELMFILYFIELLSTIDKVAYGFIFSLVVLGAISQLATKIYRLIFGFMNFLKVSCISISQISSGIF